MNKRHLTFSFGITLAAFLTITSLSIWQKNILERQISQLLQLISKNCSYVPSIASQTTKKRLHLKEKNIEIEIPADWEKVRPLVFAYPSENFDDYSKPIPFYYYKQISFPQTPVEYDGNLDQWVENVMKQYRQNGQNSPYTDFDSKKHGYIGSFNRYEVVKITAKREDKIFEDYFVKHPLNNQAVQITFLSSEIQNPDVLFDEILFSFKFADENIETETEYAYINNIYQKNNKYYLEAEYLNWLEKNGDSEANCIKNHSCIISVSEHTTIEEIHESASASLNSRYKTIQELSNSFSTKIIYKITRQNGKIVHVDQIEEG